MGQKSDFEEHWDDFVREHVVAVGWRGVKIDPARSKSRINSAGGSEDIARDVREERACACASRDVLLSHA